MLFLSTDANPAIYTGAGCAAVSGLIFAIYGISEYAQYRRRHVNGDKVIVLVQSSGDGYIELQARKHLTDITHFVVVIVFFRGCSILNTSIRNKRASFGSFPATM